ncbi:type II secretion system protein E [Amphritea balenae]|nr:type II secretion system protein E [Amphritea balenae]
MLQIELSEAGRKPVIRELDFGKHTLGRSLFADLRVKDRSVGKLHATIEVQPSDVVITAMNGNELWVDGEKQTRVINPSVNSVLRLGEAALKIVQGGMLSESLAQPVLAPAKPESADEAAVPVLTTQIDKQHKPGLSRADQAEAERWTALKKTLQQQTLEKMDLFKRTLIDGYSDTQLREEASSTASQIIRSGDIRLPADCDTEKLLQETVAESIGLGPLEPLLADDSVTEIMVNGPDQIYLERSGRLSRSTTRFTSDASLHSVIERIVTPLGRRIDEGSPMVDARLPDGSRVNAIIAPLSLIGPVVTIRKFSKERFNLQRLVEFNSLSPEMAKFLEICVKHRKNIIVCGGTGSGKTTFLNALSDCIPASDRIVTIEDAAELQLGQDHVISLESRPANIEQKGEITIRDLVRNALRMRPDRIVVGECRGGEALDMLQAMNTGHDGSLTTAHANTPRDLLSRLEVMVLQAMDVPVKVIREQIASAVDIVVHQSRFADGRRRVTSIVEIDGIEEDVVLMQKLFEFRQTGISEEGYIQGDYRSMGIAPRFYTELREAGVELDRSIFGMSEAKME